MFNQTTLIIPTYNRYPFLVRALDFYLSYDLPFPILVLDSSSDELVNSDLENLLNDRRVSYYKYPPDTFITHKFADGISHVKTPYSVLSADDDFVVPTAMNMCAKFLSQNADYSTVHGLYIAHRLLVNNHGSVKFAWKPAYIYQESIESNDPAERLNLHLSNYKTPTFHAVHRTSLLHQIWLEATKYTSDWGLSEIFPTALDLISGKMKTLHILYASREEDNFGWYDSAYINVMYSAEKCGRAVQGIGRYLMSITGMDENRCMWIAEDSLSIYLRSVKPSANYYARVRKKIGSLLLRFHLKHHVSHVLNIKTNFMEKLHLRSFRKEYALIVDDKFSLFRHDFQKIKELVLHYKLDSEIMSRSRRDYMK